MDPELSKLGVGPYRNGFDQADAFLLKIAMQIIGFGSDVFAHQHIDPQHRQIRLARGLLNLRKSVSRKIGLVMPNRDIETGGRYDISK